MKPMAPFLVSTFVVRYLLPVLATVIAAPFVLLARIWPAVRLLALSAGLVAICAVIVSLVAQGY